MSTEYLNNKNFESIIIRFQQSKRKKTRQELLIEALNNSKHGPDLLTGQQLSHQEAIGEFEASQKELATAFYLLSENIVRYAKFNLIDADDAVQEGVMICFEKIDRFDPKKGKAFNYMTTCVLNHFRQLYRTARNYNELKRKYHEFMQIQFDSEMRGKKKQTSQK